MELKMIKIKDAQTDDERVVIKALSKCNINSYIYYLIRLMMKKVLCLISFVTFLFFLI